MAEAAVAEAGEEVEEVDEAEAEAEEEVDERLRLFGVEALGERKPLACLPPVGGSAKVSLHFSSLARTSATFKLPNKLFKNNESCGEEIPAVFKSNFLLVFAALLFAAASFFEIVGEAPFAGTSR